MYLEIIGEGCRLVEAVGRAGMLVRGSCNYHIVVRGGGRFLRKTKFPREKCATIFEILRKIRKLYEPRARLPVRPGGLSRRRLDGTLPVSY